MRVVMETSIAGRTWAAMPGQEIDIDDAEAKRLIQAGQARPAAPAREIATKGADEDAARQTKPPAPKRQKRERR